MKQKTLITFAFITALPLAAAAQVKTIYGGDSRQDFYEVADAA